VGAKCVPKIEVALNKITQEDNRGGGEKNGTSLQYSERSGRRQENKDRRLVVQGLIQCSFKYQTKGREEDSRTAMFPQRLSSMDVLAHWEAARAIPSLPLR